MNCDEGILARMATVNLFYDILESLESMVIVEKVRRKLGTLEMICMTS